MKLIVHVEDNKGKKQHVTNMNTPQEIYYNDDVLDLIHNELSLLKRGERVVIERR